MGFVIFGQLCSRRFSWQFFVRSLIQAVGLTWPCSGFVFGKWLKPRPMWAQVFAGAILTTVVGMLYETIGL